jgi:hypothetical protein
VRFERDAGGGFESLFPETFSFHAERHDPAELYLRFDDLWSHPQRLASDAGRRDSEELMLRLLEMLPGTLDAVLDRLQGQQAAFLRACEDVAVFAQVTLRFIADKQLGDHPRVHMSRFHLRALRIRAMKALVEERVTPAFLEAYVAGEVQAEVPSDPQDVSFFYALAAEDPERIDRQLVGAAERAYHRWLEDVCLDESNQAFEGEESPFDLRELEVLRAVARDGEGTLERGRDLAVFLSRPRNRDCLRLLEKLEIWFLRQYDVHHAAVVRHHAENLRAGIDERERVLSLHGTRSYALALLIPSLPFLAAIFAYQRAPLFFDVVASIEVIAVVLSAAWFLVYRFMWKKDLTFFHTSVPRIGAGIIVGYLPVFLIDEVWDLAEQSLFYICAVVVLLGSTTLLYLYTEVERRLGDPREAFARAGSIFLLGLVQAAGFGLLVTSLLGPLMAARNWGPPGAIHTAETLRAELTPFVGELPRMVGVEPLIAFPTAVLLMSFLAFFIGTFLQLLWEELPITEPL